MSTDGTCITVLLPATRVPPKVVRRSVHVCTTFQTYLCIYMHTYVDIILYCPFALNKNPEVATYLLWQYCS